MSWDKSKKYPQMARSVKSLGRYAKKGYFAKRDISGIGKGFHSKHTEETKRKISLTKKGKPSKLKGIPQLHKRGENSSNWKGGITKQQKLERGWFKRYIQNKVFEKDNYTCQLCKEKGGDLQVDHIQSWVDYPELRFNIDNCRTLCKSCHYWLTYNKPMDTDKPWGHNFKYYQKGLG